MTSHTLLGMGARALTDVGASIPLAGRSKVTAVLTTAALTGAFTIAVEASPDGSANNWRLLQNVSPAGAGVLSTPLTPAAYDLFLRARVVTLTGSAFAELKLTAPWVDTAADAALFSKELRSFADGFARIVAEAEETVMARLMPRTRPVVPLYPRTGMPIGAGQYRPEVVDSYTPAQAEMMAGKPYPLLLDADMTLPGFYDAIRAAIVKQAEHLFRRHKLTQRDDPAALVTLRTLAEEAPGLMSGLARFRSESLVVWRGR